MANPPLGAAVSRLNGQFATCGIATSGGSGAVGAPNALAAVPSAAVVNLFDWEVAIEQENTDVTAHGDIWRVLVPLKLSWRARSRAYFTSAQITSYLTLWKLDNRTASGATVSAAYPGTSDAYVDAPLLIFTGYKAAASLTNADILFQGFCYVTRARISVPMAMVEQEVEFEGSGTPYFIG